MPPKGLRTCPLTAFIAPITDSASTDEAAVLSGLRNADHLENARRSAFLFTAFSGKPLGYAEK
jgi:hypothetical protein